MNGVDFAEDVRPSDDGEKNAGVRQARTPIEFRATRVCAAPPNLWRGDLFQRERAKFLRIVFPGGSEIASLR